MGFFSFFSKEKKETLDKGLSKTKESVFSKIARAVAGKSKVDDEVLDNLEEVLITSDVGVETTLNIIKRIEERVAKDKYVTTQELNRILREEIAALLTENNTMDSEDFSVPEGKKPYVIMVVGVNGVGKTTTIGKLAYQFKKKGLSVYLGAADTFRAAAVEQLDIWGERVGVPVIKQKMGADPASVAFDTLSSAVANNALNDLKEKGVWVFGAAGEGSVPMYKADMTGPAAIVIGNEGDGMSQLVRKNCDMLVHIPMKGRITSLNASAAASILLYEAVRQRLG